MNELKDVYGIELTIDDLKTNAIGMLADIYTETEDKLALTSNIHQRYFFLRKIEVVKYLAKLIEKDKKNDENN